MGQVPNAILVVGDGRVASALLRVLSSKAQTAPFKLSTQPSFRQWSRSSSQTLPEILSIFDATHVWLAISDDVLVSFVSQHHEVLRRRTVVHFSGSLPGFEFVHAAHPLSTFANGNSDSDEFAKIPFILDLTGPALSELLPGFDNPSYRLDSEKRAYYHALCSISGNFTVLLWESVAEKFETQLGLPRAALDTYRSQIFANLKCSDGNSVLTGPLVRGDERTIQRHRDSLLARFEMPMLKIYDGFIDLYRTMRSQPKEKI